MNAHINAILMYRLYLHSSISLLCQLALVHIKTYWLPKIRKYYLNRHLHHIIPRERIRVRFFKTYLMRIFFGVFILSINKRSTTYQRLQSAMNGKKCLKTCFGDTKSGVDKNNSARILIISKVKTK